MIRRLTDIEIAVRVVPTMVRWPGSEAANTLAGTRCEIALKRYARCCVPSTTPVIEPSRTLI